MDWENREGGVSVVSRKYFVGVIISVMLGGLLYSNIAYAADPLYRFMHNDHDVLVLGEITSIDENNAMVKVAKTIVSANDLYEDHPKEQLEPSEVAVMLPFEYVGFYDEGDSNESNPSPGDFALLSLNKVDQKFKIAWGAYKVNSLDYEKLMVVLPENPKIGAKMDAAAIQTFVNSDGQITEFAFDGDSGIVYGGEDKRIIFRADTDHDQFMPEDINQSKEPASVGIIGGADGPTSIYVKSKTGLTLTIIFLLFVGGFVLRRLLKTHRPK